jgi:hypothetical protein
MGAPLIKTTGQGTINAIRQVRVDAVSALFALVIPDDGCCSRLAIRVWPNAPADCSEGFVVGDKVRFTLLAGMAGEWLRAEDLVKLDAEPGA